MKILITGASGFLGRRVVSAARTLGDVIACYRNPVPETDGISVDCADLSLLEEVERVFRRWNPDVLLHTAARIPQASNESIWTYFDSNVKATVNLYDCSQRYGVSRVVLSSSMCVYGRPQSIPVSENHPTKPEAPYGLSKIQAEITAQMYAGFGIETTVLRYSGIFGAGQRSGAVPAFISACLTHAPLNLNGCGEPSSDFVWVEDAVQANLLALQHKQSTAFQVINIGSGTEMTIRELAECVRYLCNSRSEIHISSEPSVRNFRFSYDISRARAWLGYQPTSMENALRECIRQKKEGQW